jgi:hypothetical protein
LSRFNTVLLNSEANFQLGEKYQVSKKILVIGRDRKWPPPFRTTKNVADPFMMLVDVMK